MTTTMYVAIWVAFVLSVAITATLLDSYGINWRNHGLFVRLLRLKCRRAKVDEIAEMLYRHVKATSGREHDLAPVELFDEETVDEALRLLITKLLNEGVKPITIDKSRHVKIVIG